MPMKYGDPGNPILTVQINEVEIPNVLVDLGASINVITTETVHALGLCNLKHTPTVLELTDLSTVKPIGKLEDGAHSRTQYFHVACRRDSHRNRG